MRLINTTTLEFGEFFTSSMRPNYAILSHRWKDQEVSYKDYRKHREVIQHRSGYAKIIDFCNLARRRGLDWGWVDTCCIDKRSSAELSESINSMWKYYEQAAECYVYLDDLYPSPFSWVLELSPCEWFRRGWTLQELLAPRLVIFFDCEWQLRGHRCRSQRASCPCLIRSTFVSYGPSLNGKLVTITAIPEEVLSWPRGLPEVSVAMRMSWASRRITSRHEDMAYCLLGLFGINMPLLYGEGFKAFRRLQEEIVKTSEDTSIFAWVLFRAPGILSLPGILAPEPRCFAECRKVGGGRLQARLPYTVTSRGLQLYARSVCRLESAQVSEVGVNKSLWYPDKRDHFIDLGLSTDEPTWLIIHEGKNERYEVTHATQARPDIVQRRELYRENEEQLFYIEL